jgi:hypothetical protein
LRFRRLIEFKPVSEPDQFQLIPNSKPLVSEWLRSRFFWIIFSHLAEILREMSSCLLGGARSPISHREDGAKREREVNDIFREHMEMEKERRALALPGLRVL